MKEKRIFLIRHAESKANALNINGGRDTELSKKGIKQAKIVAKRFVNLDVDAILCSRYKRAIQTAKIISISLDKKIVYNDLLSEWRWPSEFRGLDANKSEQTQIWDKIWKSHNPLWHYSDEENVFEIITRAKKTLKYIKSRKENSIIVIMHAAFMAVFMGLLFFGEDIEPKELHKAYRFFDAANTGITELEINKDGGIKLVTFNDYTHLK
jgi:phosphoserine phosphatase